MRPGEAGDALTEDELRARARWRIERARLRKTTTPSWQMRRSMSDGIIEVFEALERDADECHDRGITADELQVGLRKLQLPSSATIIAHIFAVADTDGDGLVSSDELLHYVSGREQEIEEVFDGLDRSKAGVRVSDLKVALRKLGVEAGDAQVGDFLHRLDRSGSGSVSLQEFSQFVFLLPKIDIRAAFELWQDDLQTHYDLGASEPGLSAVANSIKLSSPALAGTVKENAARPAPAVVFVSGAFAGIVSRTATAPLDRLKTLMQVGASAGTSVLRGRGVLDGLREIHRAGGVRSFWQGNGANCVKVIRSRVAGRVAGAWPVVRPLCSRGVAAIRAWHARRRARRRARRHARPP